MASWCAVFSHLRIAPTYSFTSLSMLERYLRMLVRASSPVLAFPRRPQNRNAGNDVMTNANKGATAQMLSEHGPAQVFGLSLTAIFLGLLILNGISF